MDIDELKRKLRGLKKLEHRIRFGDRPVLSTSKYVWDDFFSTKSLNELTVKYPMGKLVKLDQQELKEILQEFFYCMYFQKYKESGLKFDDIYAPDILSAFGLLPGASVEDVKRKFRELAKKYHPDHGGDSSKMVEILNAYHKLINK